MALSYRLLDRLGMNEGACNHLSVMAPSRSATYAEVMLLAPGYTSDGSSLHWSKVTASSLIGLDSDCNVVEDGSIPGCRAEESAACIHMGTRKARPKGHPSNKVMFHTHSLYATALGCLKKDPVLMPMHQNSLRFMTRAATYDDYDIADEHTSEGEVIGAAMKDNDILFMQNHGVMIAALTVHLPFDNAYYLERACLYQAKALEAVGGDESKIKLFNDKTIATCTKKYTDADFLDKYSIKHFYSWWNLYLEKEPDVFH